MSNARRCDICGKFYEIKLGEKDGFAFFNTYSGGGRGYDKPKDCCPDCVEAIKSLLKSREQPKATEEIEYETD